MKRAWDALRLTFSDIWDDLFLLAGIAVVGGLLSLLVLPLPLVLAGSYGVAARIARGDTAGWNDWMRLARENAAFFYKWLLLAVLVILVLATNVWFYWRLPALWAQLAGGTALGLLLVWLLLQPYVGALYWRQKERRLLLALRNAAVVALGDPAATLLMWLLPASLLGIGGWTALLLIPFFSLVMVIFASRVVALRLEVEP